MKIRGERRKHWREFEIREERRKGGEGGDEKESEGNERRDKKDEGKGKEEEKRTGVMGAWRKF